MDLTTMCDWVSIRQFATAGLVRRLTELHEQWDGSEEVTKKVEAIGRQLDLIQKQWPFGQPPMDGDG